MIIYIHGFGGSGVSQKANDFKNYFTKYDFFSPSLSYIPSLAIQTLEDFIKINLDKNISLIGSSLGGYYAIYLANKYNLKAILINPSTKPYETMKKRVGFSKSFYDESSFEITLKHCEDLKNYEVLQIKNQKNFLLCLQKGDEILDYKIALEKLPNASLIIEEQGTHAFLNINEYFEKIEDFIGIK